MIRFWCLWGFMIAQVGFGSILPENDLHLQDDPTFESNISEEEFRSIIEEVSAIYTPIVAELGGELEIKGHWEQSLVNASASRGFLGTGPWVVNMYGGLARRPEVTKDAFALVICHELGHHVAGFPFRTGWAANEGQADYFATLSCARKIWGEQLEQNARYRKQVNRHARGLCDQSWDSIADQNLCYRTMAASQSLATLLGGGAMPSFKTPDPQVVEETYDRHPKGQCRLDTFIAGNICTNQFDETLIPKDEAASSVVTCTRNQGYQVGVRPLCWFKPGQAG